MLPVGSRFLILILDSFAYLNSISLLPEILNAQRKELMHMHADEIHIMLLKNFSYFNIFYQNGPS